MFRKILTIVLLLFVVDSTHAAGQLRPMILDDLFRIRRVSDPALSPDGKWVVFTVATPDMGANKITTDLWLVSIDGQGLRQLTNNPGQDRKAAWSPDGGWIAFESTTSSDPPQIWTISAQGGEARPFTNIATGASQPVWSPDGKNIAFISAVFPEFSDKPFDESNELNKKKLEDVKNAKVQAKVFTTLFVRHWDSWVDGRRQHIFIRSLEGGNPVDLTPGDRDAVPTSSTFSKGIDFAFSPDGKQIAYTVAPLENAAWNTNYDILAVPISGGKPGIITKDPGAEGYPRYSPDGMYIAYRAQSTPGNEADRWQLFVYDRTTGQSRSLTANFDGDVESPVWAPDSKSIFFTAQEKGYAPIFRVYLNGKETKKIADQTTNGSPAVSPDGKNLIFTRESFVRPAEIYKASADGKKPVQLSRMNDELFSALDIPQPENISYSGDGGTSIQAWLFKPPVFNPGKKYPLVLLIHGGPHSAWLNSWSYRWNAALWAAQGYVILAPNPRGSSGFGQKFSDEVTKDWGGKVFVDLMKGVDYAETLSYVDKDRKAAAGGSYGGYMINWIAGNAGDRFKTLVCHEGTFNLYSKYGTTDEVWFNEWEQGIPWENMEGYDKFSPYRYAANFKTPMLIIQNELDYRVPVSEGLQLFTFLQRKGIPSKWLYFPDEGHWVTKPANSEFWHQTVFDWLAEYLK